MFRRAALERLSTPEQLDRLVRITNPLGWLALVTVALLLGGAVAWAFLGRVPIIVQGRGVVLAAGGLQPLPSTASGQLLDILVREGDTVIAGTQVARVVPLDPTIQTRLTVVSPVSGTVAQVVAKPGAIVQAGETLVQLVEDSEMEVMLFLPVDEGKKVRKGMKARVVPSTVNQARYGYMTGTVREVSEYVVTSAEMRRVLGSDELVQIFQMGTSPYQAAPTRVEVALDRDTQTVSGWRWSSRTGPPFPIAPGTVCTAEITTERRRPIDLALPFVAQKFGLQARP